MKHHPSNKERAQFALNALRVFAGETYGGDNPDTMHPGDLETCVQDLISDLLHYYNQLPKKRKPSDAIAPHDLIMRAYSMYEAELSDPVFTKGDLKNG